MDVFNGSSLIESRNIYKLRKEINMLLSKEMR